MNKTVYIIVECHVEEKFNEETILDEVTEALDKLTFSTYSYIKKENE